MLKRIGLTIGLTIGSAILGACGGPRVTPVVPGSDIPWHADRPLTWSDFRGRVDPRATQERVAMTAASLSWGYEYRIERDDAACTYRITDVRTEAIFNQNESWVRPGYLTDSVLGHEQGHFDLTQIYKVILDDRARELIGQSRHCEGSTIEASSRFTEREAATVVRSLFDEVWERYMAAQADYDRETRNGTAAEGQRAWTERIRAALNGGHWVRPGATTAG